MAKVKVKKSELRYSIEQTGCQNLIPQEFWNRLKNEIWVEVENDKLQEDWSCGKCEQELRGVAGEVIPKHSPRCPKRKPQEEPVLPREIALLVEEGTVNGGSFIDLYAKRENETRKVINAILGYLYTKEKKDEERWERVRGVLCDMATSLNIKCNSISKKEYESLLDRINEL